MSSQSLPLEITNLLISPLDPDPDPVNKKKHDSEQNFQSLIISNLSFIVDNILQADPAGSVQIIEELLVEDKRNSYNKSIIESIN